MNLHVHVGDDDRSADRSTAHHKHSVTCLVPRAPRANGTASARARAGKEEPRAREGHQVVPRCPVVSTHISLAIPLAVSGSDAYVAVLVEHLTGGAAAAACGLVSSLSQLVERQPLVRASTFQPRHFCTTQRSGEALDGSVHVTTRARASCRCCI